MPATVRPVGKDYKPSKYPPKYLYHATLRDNLDSIRDFGIVRGFRKGVPGWKKDEDFIWLSPEKAVLLKWLRKNYPGGWIAIKVKTRLLDKTKLFLSRSGGSSWYIYSGDILPEALVLVER